MGNLLKIKELAAENPYTDRALLLKNVKWFSHL